MYRKLELERIIDTLERLHSRIEARFPGSGLGSVCAELLETGREAQARAEWISRPHIPLRLGICAVIGGMLTAFVLLPVFLRMPDHAYGFEEFVGVLEAGINVVVLVGAGLIFLVTTETRMKRGRALKAIHELRSLAQVIDMHQLTKDPSQLHGAKSTAVSPTRNMTSFELTRYLDYCSEMLSLTGKVASVYVEHLADPVVLGAAAEVETLTTGLSRKIWQKMMIVYQVKGADEKVETSSSAPDTAGENA